MSRREVKFAVHGPVQKWGFTGETHTLIADDPFWTRGDDGSVSIAVRQPTGRDRWRRRRARARHLLRRLTPWWVIALSPLLLIPIGLWTAPAAAALEHRAKVVVSVVWTGAPTCIQVHAAAGWDTTEVAACSTTQMWSTSYWAPRHGMWIGVDPEMSGAETLSCAVTVADRIVLTDFGFRNDGNEVTCLTKW